VDYSSQIEEMIKEPTWRSMLVELIIRQKIDPWDIDIDVLAGQFMKKIRELKENSFTVPGNVILACSILYKFKTMMIRIGNEEDEQPVDVSFDINEVKELMSRPARKRPITIVELMKAMEKAMKYEPRIETAMTPKPSGIKHTLDDLSESGYSYEYEVDNMSSRLAAVIEKIKKSRDTEGITLFSSILDEKGIIHSLLPVLFLANEGLADIWQDDAFGEILIRYKEVVADVRP
jgi:chromatin segregation and condensation protein Rec8/ScpA/Scc1 (kleisin family)